MNKLKPCPFCGGTKLKVDSKRKLAGYDSLYGRVNQTTYSVRCNVCHARGGVAGGKTLSRLRRGLETPPFAVTEDELKAQAIEAWNRRVSDENA